MLSYVPGGRIMLPSGILVQRNLSFERTLRGDGGVRVQVERSFQGLALIYRFKSWDL